MKSLLIFDLLYEMSQRGGNVNEAFLTNYKLKYPADRAPEDQRKSIPGDRKRLQES